MNLLNELVAEYTDPRNIIVLVVMGTLCYIDLTSGDGTAINSIAPAVILGYLMSEKD